MALNPPISDTTLQSDVENFSQEIQNTIAHYSPRVTANIMYNILQFFATGLMEDIRSDAIVRVAKREAKEQNNG